MNRVVVAASLAISILGFPACGGPEADGGETGSSEPREPAAIRRTARPGEILQDAVRWHDVDRQVDTAGLDVRFPDADGRDEVRIWEGAPPYPLPGIGPPETVRLSSEMTTYRTSWRGVVFEIRARGTGGAENAELVLRVESSPDEDRLGGALEMEDPNGAGAWIEIEHARLIKADDR